MTTLLIAVFVLLALVSPLLVLVIRFSGKRGRPDDESIKKMNPPDSAGETTDHSGGDDDD